MAQAELKTKRTRESVAAFLAKVPDVKKREDAKALCVLFEKITAENAVMWGPSIIGFGSYHYVSKSGREGDWMQVGFSPRAAAFSLYLTGCMYGFDEVRALLEKLGPHKTGKGCLYIKRLSDVDIKVLEKLIKTSLKHLRELDKKK